MGCGASAPATEPARANVHYPAQTKPVAPVQPQQQRSPPTNQNASVRSLKKQNTPPQSNPQPPNHVQSQGGQSQPPAYNQVTPVQHTQDQRMAGPPQNTSAPQQPSSTVNQEQRETPMTESPKQTNSHNEPPSYNQPEETDIEMKPVEIVPALLTQYNDLEKEIRQMEKNDQLKNLKATMDEIAELEDTLKQLQEHYNRCVQKTAKEKEDVNKVMQPNVKAFLKDNFDAAFTKEQEEYLEALNAQEIAKKDLDGITQRRDKLLKEVESKKDDATKLYTLYKRQDELLASVFDGKYGSEREYELEAELDDILDRKQRIGVARQKWQNARLLVHHAATQLAAAVKCWLAMAQVSVSNTKERYRLATEARNNLIASSQNMGSAQRYLGTIQFPYCKPDEVTTLNKAIGHIYVDMQSRDRFKHALECYSVTYRRCFALLQWFDHVIANTIVKDLAASKKAVKKKEKELKQERLRLLKAKITEQHSDFVAPPDEEDDEEEEEEDGTKYHGLEDIDDLFREPDAVSLTSEDGLTTDSGCTGDPETGETARPCVKDTEVEVPDESNAPTPLPLNELAPPPSSDVLFGDIADIKKQHEQDMEEIKRAQEVNKARMDQGLQEKLRARRSRRKRQMAREEIEEKAAAKSNRTHINVMKAVMGFTA